MQSNAQKLLVTGGAGYVGSHVVRYLIQEKGYSAHDIIIFDNFSTGHPELVPDGAITEEGDLRNAEEIALVFGKYGISAVIHLAGMLNVAESMSEPAAYFYNNVTGGVNLLEAMRSSSCRTIVFSSSCTVYGQAPSPVAEDAPCEPISPYGESKLQFERWLNWYCQVYGFKAVSLRYFNAAGAAYGIGEWHKPEIHLIPSVLRAALHEQEVTIYGTDYDTSDGTCVRDYVHVQDLAYAHVLALEHVAQGSSGFSAFNLGFGRGASVQEVVRLAEKVTGKQIRVRHADRRRGDAAAMFASTAKAADQLGWRPHHSIEDCIGDALQWLRSRQH